ncbi:Hypothetical protein CINCED_3A006274 [Cinara cedri]|uniref:Uncharacterized protein n=1 Tax=Cinara cedri TaxID=506608 RepID=A0A5E4MKG1_9HEMI|nr:Hypothetical protein CINCED_3A006274 [Cinara cedri]
MSPCASVVGYESQLLADQTYEDHNRGVGGSLTTTTTNNNNNNNDRRHRRNHRDNDDDNDGQQRSSSSSARPEPTRPKPPPSCRSAESRKVRSGVVYGGPSDAADVSALCRHFLAAYNIRPDFFCKFQGRTSAPAAGRQCRFSGTDICLNFVVVFQC